jgi:transcriptional regulator with XRE-family HTH domain
MIHPLRLQRLQKGISQYHLAWELGIPQVRISYAERGYPSLTDRQKDRLADYFGTSVDDLFPAAAKIESDEKGDE